MRLLGRPGIEEGERASEPPAGKTIALLYYLAYRRDWVRREELLGLLYPESDEVRARQNLRALVTKVRRDRLASGVEIEAARLRWAVATDVAAFEAALEEGRLAAAVELYRGPLLEGFVLPKGEAFQDWLEGEREALARHWRDAVLGVGRSLVENGRHGDAAEVAAKLLAADPLDEPALRLRLRAQAGTGERAAALDAYRAFADMLDDELGVEPEVETSELVERLRSDEALPRPADERPEGSTSAGSSPVASRSGRRLPRALVPFVGRESELALLRARLDAPDCRLVTLVGAGGMGKTALALELGRRLEEAGRDVVFVPLETVGDVDAAVALIGDAVGMAFYGRTARRDQLMNALSSRGGVIILDNVEQVQGVAGLVTSVLERTADLTVLVTSRERLAVRAECVVAIEGLRVEGDSESEAARLFASAAQRANGRFETGLSPESVARVCRLVGGMPLALELAAGWSPVLSVEDIAAGLESGLQLLRGNAVDRPARHRDVRSVLEASWSRLDAVERRALAGLAVFTGGFTEEAAKAVAEVDASMLLRLARGSLVRRDDGARYRQHALVWRYARERAKEDGRTWALLRERHGLHFAGRMARVAALAAERPEELRPEEAPELPNVAEAWAWMVENRRRDLLAQSLDGLYELGRVTQRQLEVSRYVMDAAEALGDASALHGRLLRAVGSLRTLAVDFDAAMAPLRRSLEIAETKGDRREEGLVRFHLGLAGYLGHMSGDDTRSNWERCVALFREAGDRYLEARALVNLADHEVDPRQREAMQRTAVRGFRSCNGYFGLTLALLNLSLTARCARGAYAAASELLDEAAAVEREHGDRFRLAWWLASRGEVLLDWGRTDDAARVVEEAERVSADLAAGFGAWEVDHALLVRGRLRLSNGDPDGAAEALGWVARGVSGLPDPFGRKREARSWWALAEARAGRSETAERLAVQELEAGPPSAPGVEHEWWPGGAVAARVLADVRAASGDALGAAAALWPALEAVTRLRLLPAALELCLGAASVNAARGEPDAARSLLTLVSRHPATAAHARADAEARLAAFGAAADDAGAEALAEDVDLVLDTLVASMPGSPPASFRSTLHR